MTFFLDDFLIEHQNDFRGTFESTLNSSDSILLFLEYLEDDNLEEFLESYIHDILTIQDYFAHHHFDYACVNICATWQGTFYNTLGCPHTMTPEQHILHFLNLSF